MLPDSSLSYFYSCVSLFPGEVRFMMYGGCCALKSRVVFAAGNGWNDGYWMFAGVWMPYNSNGIGTIGTARGSGA